MKNLYDHWKTDFIIKKYNQPRHWDKRFLSETYFLDKIIKPGNSVLDVGCATGDLCLGLREKFGKVYYTGLDISGPLIERARELLPEAIFIEGDIFQGVPALEGKKFDLVTATGVFQHEPKYKELLPLLLKYVKDGGYLLFDIKLFHTHPTLCDIERAYGEHTDHRVFYIICNFKDFLNLLDQQKDIDPSVEFYGYCSGVNQTVRLPKTVREEVCSAHVLLQKGDRKSKLYIKLNLPPNYLVL